MHYIESVVRSLGTTDSQKSVAIPPLENTYTTTSQKYFLHSLIMQPQPHPPL